jgi:hypothetical protein
LIFGSVLWKTLRGRRKAPSGPVPAERTLSARVIGAAFGLLLGALIVLLLHSDYVLPISPTRPQRILLSGGPWALAIALLIVSGKLQRRRAALNQWKTSPGWERPKTAEIDVFGYHVSDDVTRHHYAWPHFTRARETENLLILHAEDSRQHIIPKRAFANPAEIQQCRAMLQTFIGKTDFMVAPGGFEVIPTPVLPLPGLPETTFQPATADTGTEPIVPSAAT